MRDEEAEGAQKKKRGRSTKRDSTNEDRGENKEDAKIRRLEKNRLSAKESRVRKKQYMSRLEERNNILEKERAKLLRKINNLEDMQRLQNFSQNDTVS